MYRLHFLQNVTFETPAYLQKAAARLGFQTSITDLSKPHTIPDVHSFDVLVIMGGPMNVAETQKYPWLVGEKKLIEQALNLDKKIVGICLGAQLIANVMGAEVKRNEHKEIGWHQVILDPNILEHRLFSAFPSRFSTFHWHGDTFSIPGGAERIGSSAACPNQGFVYGDHVVALQFHPEITKMSIENLLANCADELIDAPFIQNSDDIRSDAELHIEKNHNLIDTLLFGLTADRD